MKLYWHKLYWEEGKLVGIENTNVKSSCERGETLGSRRTVHFVSARDELDAFALATAKPEWVW